MQAGELWQAAGEGREVGLWIAEGGGAQQRVGGRQVEVEREAARRLVQVQRGDAQVGEVGQPGGQALHQVYLPIFYS
jgi:hypothetical protein